MGVDNHITVLNTSKYTKDYLKSRKDLLTSIENQVNRPFRFKPDSVDKLVKVIEEAENSQILDVSELRIYFTGLPHFSGELNDFWLGKSSSVFSNMPKVLEKHSEEAANLWHKLIGSWKQIEDNKQLEKPYKFYIGDKEYRINSNRGGGYLQGEEIKLMTEELRKLLEKTDKIYNELERERIRKAAKEERPIELIFSIMKQTTSTKKDTILYSMNT